MTPRRAWLQIGVVILGLMTVGLISKNFGHFTYKEPERLSPQQARQRRLFSELERQRKALEAQPSRLSPANKVHAAQLQQTASRLKEQLRAAQGAASTATSIAKRNPSFMKSVPYKAAMSRYFQARQQSSAFNQVYRSWQGLGPPLFNYRFNPNAPANLIPGAPGGAGLAANVTGAPKVNRRRQPRVYFDPRALARWAYHTGPELVDPCQLRAERKEVLFANKRIGRGVPGLHVPHKWRSSSWVGC